MLELVRDTLKQKFRISCDNEFVGLISPVSDAYKKKGMQSFQDRLNLCNLATSTSTWIKVSTVEGERSVWTPTLDAIQELTTLHKPSLGSVFVCGGDVFESWLRPGLWADADLHSMCNASYVAVVTRDGSNHEKVLSDHPIFKETPALRERVLVVNDELNDNLSSTFVRNSILAGRSIKYLVPEPVHDYLQGNPVYTEESMKINSDLDVFKQITEVQKNRTEDGDMQ